MWYITEHTYQRIVGREYDEPKSPRSFGLFVNHDDSVVHCTVFVEILPKIIRFHRLRQAPNKYFGQPHVIRRVAPTTGAAPATATATSRSPWTTRFSWVSATVGPPRHIDTVLCIVVCHYLLAAVALLLLLLLLMLLLVLVTISITTFNHAPLLG
jgi:hypothetical protein